MTATIELSQDEVCTAIAEYVQRSGWKTTGKVAIRITRGYSDQREGTTVPDSVAASVTVVAQKG